MTNEPSFIEISAAYNNCCLSSAFNPNRYCRPTESSLERLRELRFKKLTWYNHEENHLRVEIDRYLRENNSIE